MDFIDWRKSPEKITIEPEQDTSVNKRRRGKAYYDYIDEQIRAAQERGDFDHLSGAGKPLKLDDNTAAGDKRLAYSLLKSNGFAPAEVELAKEIRSEMERAEKRLKKIQHWRTSLRRRRFLRESERQTFNTALARADAEYEKILRELNSKILTLNITAPPSMHMPPIAIEQRLKQFREDCSPL